MIENLLKYIRAIIFVGVVVVCVKLLDFAMMPSGYIRYIINQVDNPDDDENPEGYDCIVLGASHSRSAIDPEFLKEAGYASNPINLGIPGESLVNSYYLLREACENNDVKKVILEMDYQYWTNDEARDSDFGDLFIYVQMPWSRTKLEYIGNELLDKDFRTVFFKKLAYTSDFGSVPNIIKTKTTKEYRSYSMDAVEVHDAGGPYVGRGFFYRENVGEEKPGFWLAEWSQDEVSSKVLDTFDKIVGYCRDKDIELVCVTEPIPPYSVEVGPSAVANTYLKDICQDRGVRYIDYNLISEEELTITNEDFCDWEGHMYGELAERFSKVMAWNLAGKKCTFYKDYEELLKNRRG